MYFIAIDGETITGLYSDDGDFAAPPLGAVSVTDAEFVLLKGGMGKYKFINSAIVDNLDHYKARQIRLVEDGYKQAIGIIADGYPETERSSWAKQEQEARAWTANNATATPLLSAIAAARGDTLAIIAAKVIGNADAYAFYAGGVIGHRQALLSQLSTATTRTEIEAIAW